MDAGTLVLHYDPKGSVSLSGKTYPLSSLELDLQVGALPVVRCLVATKDGQEGGVSVEKAGLAGFSPQVAELLSKSSNSGETGSVSFSMATGESVSLDGWPLLAAGITNVAAAGCEFGIQVELGHPAHMAASNSGLFCDPEGEVDLEDMGGNPLEIGSNVLDQLAATEDREEVGEEDDGEGVPPDGLGVEEMMALVQGRMAAAASGVRDNFDDSGLGLPLTMCLDEDSVAEALARYWVSADYENGSVMSVLASVMSSTGLQIIPDYTKRKLPVAPIMPWKTGSKYEVPASDVSTIQFPGVDPAPISGVSLSSTGHSDIVLNASNFSDQIKSKLEDESYGTIVFTTKTPLPGAVVSTSTPPWIPWAAVIDASKPPQSIDVHGSTPPEESGGSAGSEEPESLEGVSSARMRYASYVFMKEFKSKLQAIVTVPFDPGKYIPGERASILDEDGGVMFTGFLYRCVSSIDMYSGKGITRLVLSHCAPDGGYDAVRGYNGVSPLYG